MSEAAAAPAPSAAPVTSAPAASSSSAAPAGGGTVTPIKGVDAKASPAVPAAPRKLSEPLEIKFKGRTEKIDDYERLQHLASKGYASNEAWEEAKKYRDDADARLKPLEAFKSGDVKARRAALREMGMTAEDVRNLAEQELWEHIQAEEQTPEQRELTQLRAEREERKSRDEMTAKEAAAASLKEDTDRELASLKTTFAQALKATGAAPSALPHLLPRIAKLEERNRLNGINATPEMLAAEAMEGSREESRAVFGGMTGDELIEWLGDGIIGKVRKSDLARLRASRAGLTAQQQPTQSSSPTTPASPGKKYDWRTNSWTESQS